VLTVNGTYYIDPYAVGATDRYISYFRQNLVRENSFICGVPDPVDPPARIQAACRGNEMRTYRLAVANTGEYAQAPGINAGNDPVILHAAIVTTVNRVVGVYESELAISMVLIANNNNIEFLNAATDPFTGNNSSGILINESQTVITNNIGAANYDIGHTFSTGGGGLAQLNSVCGGSKARGITGSSNPTGDAYDIDYVAHEVGHQFGGNHSMNGCGDSPNSTKYEPGSGTTIQAYAGICGTQNIQPNSDPVFHPISFDEISNFLSTGNGGSCGVVTPTNNNLPVIDPLPNNNLSIPINTPFTLTGSATDVDGDALTYSWDEMDLGNPGASWNAGATLPPGNTVPLFRTRLPKTTGSRTFPDIRVIAANYPTNPPSAMNGLKGEILSPVARPMKFRLTVRDNRAGGGGVVSSGSNGCQNAAVFQVNVVGSEPFVVTSPNGGESYPGGLVQNITWNVAGTNAAPINVSNVRITLSTDGGLTYPTELVASTPNDGSEALVIPSIATTGARIKIEALGNIFFDISNANFTITAPVAS
ncbi:MAG TPA: zinc-dependent metalloprotease family protein, partial [Chitinophagaceae bacterium]|nr:zinc-dependent metalloprotease family protein [Chitinophagaceae bacterium]